MNIIIRNEGDTPIYEQIVTQIKGAILAGELAEGEGCLLYTSPSPRDGLLSRMPSSA